MSPENQGIAEQAVLNHRRTFIDSESGYSGITRLSPPLVDEPAYSIIHKKHQALIPAIVSALQEMKADGTFEKIEEDVLKEFTLN